VARSIYCYDCKKIKENVNKGYCRACNRKRDNEWRISTGRTIKHQTGKCGCGNERVSYSPVYCKECAAKCNKKARLKYKPSLEVIKRKNERQRKNYRILHPVKILKTDEINKKRRQQYHDNSPIRIRDRIKHQVRALTRSYIKSGKLIKGKCEVCADINVEAHHDDYDKPMDIRWLCKKHHMAHHKKL
jgi:hypothetical protein